MAAVTVVVNGRSYKIACNDGEEDQLRNLASTVNDRVQDVVAMVGQIGDLRLLLMAAMLIADELATQNEKLDATQKAIAELQSANAQLQTQTGDAEGIAADQLEAAAGRIEAVLATLTEK
jgi:cell division protein ZapA